ncbi:disease resistance protein PIK6-NP-like isoform X3 [Phragmites australis]|uniref:disease resistance protein PIK6-NP-like isoform X3 n=1 Tax=Phragmites australis TaxID=29695 RepID=UPI002D76B94F|nr:disease resistance protein PIK6-NP-like isoform X3 [Phragmites australis]
MGKGLRLLRSCFPRRVSSSSDELPPRSIRSPPVACSGSARPGTPSARRATTSQRMSKACMELAMAALGRLLPKLGSLLTDEYKLQKGVRGQIKFLQAEMESMQAALKELSQLPAHQIGHLDKLWARDLNELSYDIEDSVDTFMVRIEDAPVGAKPHSLIRRLFDRISGSHNRLIGLLTKAKTRYHVVDDIEDIKSRIHDVAARRKRYKLNDIAVQPDTTAIDPRVPALFEEAAKLVGTDGPAEKISNLLTQGTDVQKQKLMVVSIVGVGGLGKTTVANLVYERLRGQFDCRAFVSVSLKPNMKQILSSILRQVSKDTCINAGEKELDELIRSIREILNDKSLNVGVAPLTHSSHIQVPYLVLGSLIIIVQQVRPYWHGKQSSHGRMAASVGACQWQPSASTRMDSCDLMEKVNNGSDKEDLGEVAWCERPVRRSASWAAPPGSQLNSSI